MNPNYKMVTLYKRGSLSSTAIRELKAAGYVCIAVKEFTDVQFRMAAGIGFEEDMDDMQLLIMKAALETFNFPEKIGALIAKRLKQRVSSLEQK